MFRTMRRCTAVSTKALLVCLSLLCSSSTAFVPSRPSVPWRSLDEAELAYPRADKIKTLNKAVAMPEASPPSNVPFMDALAGSIQPFGGDNAEYKRGLMTVGVITTLFSSNSPALHALFSGDNAPPVFFVNAAVSFVALGALLVGGSALESSTPLPSTLKESESSFSRGGLELGLWKFLGTTANIAGLSLTSAGHGAFLIQLTTLIVPVVQGIMGVPIPRRIQASVALALLGVVMFTQDASESASHVSAMGDALCVVAAAFYATYDLRLFHWGKLVPPRQLITGKIATQATLSFGLLATCGLQETVDYIQSSSPQLELLIPIILWSGVAVNAVAPYLQVGAQQAVGPTRCQTIYASQPLWASIMSFVFLQETVGTQGLVGGAGFLAALFLAASAEAPDSDCGEADSGENPGTNAY